MAETVQAIVRVPEAPCLMQCTPWMGNRPPQIVGADTLKTDRAILNCSMYWSTTAHLWCPSQCFKAAAYYQIQGT